MRIAAFAAVSALLALSAVPAGAYAMFIPGPTNNVVCRGVNCGGGGSGGSTCAAICGTPEIAKDAAYKDCSDHLANLPPLSKRDVFAIGPEQRLHLSPVCENYADRDLTAKQVNYLERGNVAGLEAAIEANPVLKAELASHHYKVGDVLGLLVGDNAVVLYVHKM